MNNKDKAKAYHNAVSRYDVVSIEKMVDANYIQHNPHVPTGRAAFVSLLPKLKEHGSRIENIRMLQDGPFIIMHHLWKGATPFGSDEMVAFHIIRFDERGLIAEHWNVMTENTPPNLSGRTLFDGEREITDVEKLEENKAKIVELFRMWTNGERDEVDNHSVEAEAEKKLHHYFHTDYFQHHPLMSDGIKGHIAARKVRLLDLVYTKNHKVFGEGNFVLSISEAMHRRVPTACYDLFRLHDGLIAEHWSVYQEIPQENLANQNTMFSF